MRSRIGFVVGVVSLLVASSSLAWNGRAERVDSSSTSVQSITRATVSARQIGPRRVLVTIRRYYADCAWSADFRVQVRGHRINVMPARMPSRDPSARSACGHDVTYSVDSLEPGTYKLRLRLNGWEPPGAGDRGMPAGWLESNVTVQ